MIRSAIVFLALAFASAAAAQEQQPAPPPPLFDGPALIRPPAEGSPEDAADRLSMHPAVGAERLAQARADQQFSPWSAMAPVLGADFNEARFPSTARVFGTLLIAFGQPLNVAKQTYARRRPFLDNPNVIQCDAPTEDLATNGSFPSGHAAAGWAWALLLAELIPSRADAILQRGYAYGESRVICGVHYPSDVEAGRVIASAAFARLHADPTFRSDLDAARRELSRAFPG